MNPNPFGTSCTVPKCEEGVLSFLFYNEYWTSSHSLFTSANCWDLVRYLTTKMLSERRPRHSITFSQNATADVGDMDGAGREVIK